MCTFPSLIHQINIDVNKKYEELDIVVSINFCNVNNDCVSATSYFILNFINFAYFLRRYSSSYIRNSAITHVFNPLSPSSLVVCFSAECLLRKHNFFMLHEIVLKDFNICFFFSAFFIYLPRVLLARNVNCQIEFQHVSNFLR